MIKKLHRIRPPLFRYVTISTGRLADDVGAGDFGLACGAQNYNKTLCPKTPVLDELASSR
jgi:hypothetical protein